jgi:hypothetical protein
MKLFKKLLIKILAKQINKKKRMGLNLRGKNPMMMKSKKTLWQTKKNHN